MNEDDLYYTTDENESFRVRSVSKENMDFILSSPLAVNTGEMSVVAVSPLRFHNFNALPAKMLLFNNGLTVTLSGDWTAGRRPSIEGSDLPEKYLFSHLHFHWSSEDKIGSEHVINGQGYTMEMHLIFFKESCKTIFEAEPQRNGCLTLAYLFDITPDRHVGIEYISECLNDVQTCGQMIEIPIFRLSYLVDQLPGEYFTYTGKADKFQGTYTISKWIVFTKIYKVNSQQMEQFRRLSNKRGQPIKRNCRTAVSAMRNRDDGTNAVPYLVTGIFAGDDVRTDEKSKVVRPVNDRPFLRVNKTHLLRREFNREKVVSHVSRTSTIVADTPPRSYSRNAVAVHPKTTDHSVKVVVTSATSLSSKPSWK